MAGAAVKIPAWASRCLEREMPDADSRHAASARRILATRARNALPSSPRPRALARPRLDDRESASCAPSRDRRVLPLPSGPACASASRARR